MDISNLIDKIWKNLFEKIKKLTGQVDFEKGTLQEQIDGKAPTEHTHDSLYFRKEEVSKKLDGKLDSTLKGISNGLAELDSNGLVPSNQLPSFVDDVLEGTASGTSVDEKTNAISATGFILKGQSKACTPESGKIYLDVNTNIQYRWSGSVFISTGSFLALGETSETAFRGDFGKTAYEHSQATGNPHGTTKANIGLSNVPNVATNDQTPTFSTAAERVNIKSGEKISVLFGKISKFFTDLKTVAFTGSYTDLSNKPTIPAAVSVKGNAETAYRTGEVNLTPANIGALATNGDSKACKTTFTTNDVADANATSWTAVSALTSGLTHAVIFQRMSQMFKNVRYLYKVLGTTDISKIGNGTVKGAISTLSQNKAANEVVSDVWSSSTTYAAGSYCIYNNVLWKCLVQHSNQTPAKGTYWTQVSVDSELTALNGNLGNLIIDKLYPVGSIYLETTNTNPSTKLGGTWASYGTSDSYLRLGGNSSGGSNSVTLNADNIPSLSTNETGSHQHTFWWQGAHSHYYATTPGGTQTNSYETGNNAYLQTGSTGKDTHETTITVSGSTSGDGAHSHTITNNNQQPININPKYVQVYAWKRIA